MHVHRSKRDLASTTPELAASISYSSLSDSTTRRYQHGHQHDHLHDPHRGRGVNNSEHAVLTNEAVPNLTSGPFAASGVNATPAGTSGIASLSEHLVDQPAAAEISTSPLADGQDVPRKSVTRQMTVPQSLLEDQPAMTKSNSAYSGTSPTSKATAEADTQSMLQEQFSTAGRVSLFGEPRSILRVIAFGLWVFFFAIM